MKTKGNATIEDLYQVEGKAELVDGEIVYMSPTGFLPTLAASRILGKLLRYEEETGKGFALGDNMGYVVNLPHRKSFSPDASFTNKRGDMRFLNGAPLFAVEVRSEGDYGPAAEKAIAAKRADYFAAGAQIVWDVDLLSEDVIRVYRITDPDNPAVYHRGESAEAEPALPGWTMPVDDLFPRE